MVKLLGVKGRAHILAYLNEEVTLVVKVVENIGIAQFDFYTVDTPIDKLVKIFATDTTPLYSSKMFSLSEKHLGIRTFRLVDMCVHKYIDMYRCQIIQFKVSSNEPKRASIINRFIQKYRTSIKAYSVSEKNNYTTFVIRFNPYIT